MLGEWMAEGYDYDDIELWAVGYPGQEEYVSALVAGGLTDAVFVDSTEPTESARTAFSATSYDTFVIDSVGRLSGFINVGRLPLSTASNRTLFHYIVLDVLDN